MLLSYTSFVNVQNSEVFNAMLFPNTQFYLLKGARDVNKFFGAHHDISGMDLIVLSLCICLGTEFARISRDNIQRGPQTTSCAKEL